MSAPARRPSSPNFTLLQFIVFAGVALVALAALLAAGLALGLALAGAALISVLALAVSGVCSNLIQGRGGRPPHV